MRLIKFRYFIVSVVIFSVNCLSAQSDSLSESNSNYWNNSLYLSYGYGLPQGHRFEVGYNYWISPGLTFGIGDNWSRDPAEGTLGILAKIHFPIYESNVFYLLFCIGGTMAILGEPDTYSIVHFGSKIQLSNGIQLCPEMGWTFKHISGGRSIFGSSPETREQKTNFGINISLEIDFAHI